MIDDMAFQERPGKDISTPDGEPRPASDARIRQSALALLTLLLLALCMVVAYPFLPAITWGVAFAIIAWPVHAWINRRIERRGLAAGLTVLIVIALIVAPSAFAAYTLAKEAATASTKVQEGFKEATIAEKMAEVPALAGLAKWLEEKEIDIEGEMRKRVSAAGRDLFGLATGSLAALLQFLVAMFILYHLLHDRSATMKGLRDLLPLSRTECERVFQRAADSVHANLYATVVSGVINGVTGGLVFWFVGLPAALLWGIVMAILSILPMLGTPMIWIPATVYLGMTGEIGPAAVVLAWGVISWFIVGNIIYVRLAGNRMQMHDIPAMVSFLGGLAVFGVSGMVLGPAIFAVTMAFLEVWRERMHGPSANDATGHP